MTAHGVTSVDARRSAKGRVRCSYSTGQGVPSDSLDIIGSTPFQRKAAMADIVLRNLNDDLKKLAADIRALSAGRRQTPSEKLLRESRDER